MDHDFKLATLGRTGLKVGRLGLAGSYGAPARSYEMAFDKGCNYFYSGSGRKRSQMKQAVKSLADFNRLDPQQAILKFHDGTVTINKKEENAL